MAISKAEACRRTRLLPQALARLIALGAVQTTPQGKVLEDSLAALIKGKHYVTCLECQCRTLQLSQHLPACCNQSVETYLGKYPDAALLSDFARLSRAKTTEQKDAQSKKLRARFQTPEGLVTKQQISAAAHRMQASEYGERAANHLRFLGTQPEMRAARSRESQQRWDTGSQRELVGNWHRDNREQSLQSACHARQFITKKATKPHKAFKAALVQAGVEGFVTEHSEGFYSIDEAHPGLKIALEVDGCYWHGCNLCGFPGIGGIVNLDKRKTTYLLRRGWLLLRFAEHAINSDLAGCVQQVVTAKALREAT